VKPRKHIFRLALGAALAVATTAFAFFLVATFSGEGSATQNSGSAPESHHTLPVTVSFAEGVTPANPVPVSLMVENPSSEAAVVTGPKVVISTPAVPQCGEEWLEVEPETFSGEVEEAMAAKMSGANTEVLAPIPAGAGPKSIGNYYRSNGGAGVELVKRFVLRFKPSMESVNETACQNTAITITAKVQSPTH
jgi:hypothetical protein